MLLLSCVVAVRCLLCNVVACLVVFVVVCCLLFVVCSGWLSLFLFVVWLSLSSAIVFVLRECGLLLFCIL